MLVGTGVEEELDGAFFWICCRVCIFSVLPYGLYQQCVNFFSFLELDTIVVFFKSSYSSSKVEFSDRIISPTFNELQLTAQQVFAAGNYSG